MKVLLRRVFDGLERDAVLVTDSQFLIGRANDCHLRPFAPLVGHHHCRIEVKHGLAKVRDLKSARGTYVNYQRVHSVRELNSGDVLLVGMAIYEVLLLEESDESRLDAAPVAERVRLPFRQRWEFAFLLPAHSHWAVA